MSPVVREIMKFTPRERSFPWGWTAFNATIALVIYEYRWRKERRRIGRTLPTREYGLAVRCIDSSRYFVNYLHYEGVHWRPETSVRGDPWYTAVYWARGEPAALDITVYDNAGQGHRRRLHMGALFRANDSALDAILSRSAREPRDLSYRLFLDIRKSTVRLVAFPGLEPCPRNDKRGNARGFHRSGKTIWLGRRDSAGRWIP